MHEMKVYKFKAYSKAKDGVQDRLITRFGLVRNYAAKMMEKYSGQKETRKWIWSLSNSISSILKSDFDSTSRKT